MTLAKLLEETKECGEMLRDAREKARPACIAAVRKLEAALVEALGGEKLKGLPLLDESMGQRFYGARARGRRIDGKLGGKAVLVVGQDGNLRMAYVSEAGGVEDVGADDSELLVEDVEDVARAVEEVLRRHVELIGKSAARYEAFSALAKKLEAALAA